MTISVLIATRNRAPQLKRCLMSLQKQSIKPNEVILVDNGSTDNTREVCSVFRFILPIRYKKEQRIGLPFARNTSMQLARGDIYAFIDDDCIASRNWLKAIQAHFGQHLSSVGVIGFSQNAHPSNIASCVEYAYYLRWLYTYIMRVDRPQKLPSGLFIDFKNAAFRASFIKQFQFSTIVPYGGVGDEDVEMGNRIYRTNQNIYYNPTIKVTHQYSVTLKRLFVRNFWNGYNNQKLYQTHGVNVFISSKKSIINSTLKNADKIQGLLKGYIYKTVKAVFPLFSKLGRLCARFIDIKQPVRLKK